MASIEELTERLTALETEVHELRDEREIRGLLAQYDYSVDCKRDEQWLGLWTDDGVYDLVSTVQNPDGSSQTTEKRYSGKKELQDLMDDPNGVKRPAFYGHSVHSSGSNMVMQIDADSAVVNSYSLLFQEHDDVVSLVSAASNRWTVKRVDGRWRIQERRRRQAGTPAFIDNIDESHT